MPLQEQSLADKAAVVVFSRLLTTLVEIATIIFLVNVLAKETFAVFGFLILVHQTAREFATFGFPESVFYFFERVGLGARRGFAYQTGAILVGTGLTAGSLMVGLALLAPYILSHWGAANLAAVQRLLPVLALAVAFEVPSRVANTVLLAQDRQKDAAVFQVVTSLIGLAALVLPIALGYSIDVAVYCVLLYSALRLAIAVVWSRAVLPPGGEALPKGMLGEQVRFSIPLGLFGLTHKVNKYVDKFIVSILLTAAAFAEYQVGGQEIPILPMIAHAVGSVLISRFVRFELDGKRDELLALWHRSIQAISLFVLPLAVLLIVVAEDFVALLFGDAYLAAVAPLQIYSLILFHRVAHYGTMLQTFGDTKGILRLTFITLCINVVLNIPFTLLLGITGTALATLIAMAIGWVLFLRRIAHHLEVPFRRVLPWGFYLKVLALAAVSGGLAWLLRRQLGSTVSRAAALGITVSTFLALFSVSGSLGRVITREDWKVLWAWARLRFIFG